MSSRPSTSETEKPSSAKLAPGGAPPSAAELAKIAALKLHEMEVSTSGEWDNLLGRKGLFVVDVYQSCWGPCKAMYGVFLKTKNLMTDPDLFFALAKSDNVDALVDYRTGSRPTFLFIASGSLVAVVRGVDAPLLVQTLHTELQREKRVMSGQEERRVFVDPVIVARIEEEERRRKEEEEAARKELEEGEEGEGDDEEREDNEGEREVEGEKAKEVTDVVGDCVGDDEKNDDSTNK